jgi:outer membrane protein OmpA-like peptidoglycan-associated protein
MPDVRIQLSSDGSGGPAPLQAGLAHRVVVQRPGPVCVRLVGMFFELAKCFLLPSAVRGIRKVKSIYDGHPGAQVLVVGHTDTSGSGEYNNTLSLERSRAVIGYLTDDVEAWVKFYGNTIADEKRWGKSEDRQMLSALPDGGTPFATAGTPLKDALASFQSSKGLPATGTADLTTRRALITDYMALDQTSLPPGTVAVAHGCGENFPDVATQDGVREPRNRRVEVFVFDPTIDPPATQELSGKDAKDYPAWKAKVSTTFDFASADISDSLELRLHDESSRPLAGTFYRVISGGAEPTSGQAGSDGFVHLELPSSGAARIELEWGASTPDGPFTFARSISVRFAEGTPDEQDRARLHNLGYDADADFASAARAFQADYQVDNQPQPIGLQGGGLPPASRKQLDDIFVDQDCDASPPNASS